MKIFQSIILSFLVLLGTTAYSAPTGPPPPGVPPPGFPIDSSIVALVLVALLYGMYKINNLKLNKKTPM
jgi:hypothetical protein